MSEVRNGARTPSNDEVRDAVVDCVLAEPAVIAAYLFGSVARAQAGPLSDIDVGLVIRPASETRAACDYVTDSLMRRLQTSRVDVVALDAAPLPVRYRAIRDGVLVVCRDALVVERFVVDTVRQYLDFKPLRDRAFQTMRAAIIDRS